MPYLSFDSAADLAEAIMLGETKTKAAYYGQNRSLFTSMKESMIQNDPILSYEATLVDSQEIEPGASVYDRFGYDELVPNKAFASLLNARGEICVGDLMYKISPRGTYYFPVSKRAEFEQNYAKYEMMDGTETAEKTYLIDTDVYRFDTFDAASKMEFEDDMPETKASWSEFPVNTGPWRKVLNGQDFHYGLPDNRRLKGTVFHYDYVVYDDRGAIAKCQKKAWIGWSAVTSRELSITWDNIIMQDGETAPVGTHSPYWSNSGSDRVTIWDKTGVYFIVGGYRLPDDKINDVVRGGQTKLRSIIRSATNIDIGNAPFVRLIGPDCSQTILTSQPLLTGSFTNKVSNQKECTMSLAHHVMGATPKPVGGQFWFLGMDDNGNVGGLRIGTAF